MSIKSTAQLARCALLAATLMAALTAPNVARAQGGGNLLKNGGFDWPAQTNGDVCAPGWSKGNAITPHEWTPFWACKNGEERNQDRVNRPPEYRVMTVDIAANRVRSYPTSASFFTFWALNRSMGLYQTVSGVTPGTKLRFSAWANLLTTDSDELPLNSSRAPGGLQARVCIQTAGVVVLNPNFNDPSIVCGAWVRPYDTWGEMWVEATASASEVIAIIDTTAEYPVKHNDVHVDDAVMTIAGQSGVPAQAPAAAVAVAAPQPAAAAAAPAANDNGPRVIIKGPTGNVRAGPGYDAVILAAEPQGSSFAIRAYTPDKQWWQIEYAGGQGGTAFIHTSVVDLNAAAQTAVGGTAAAAPAAPIAAQPAPQLQPTAAPAPVGPSPAAQVVVTTGGGRLIVRSAPNATGAVIGKIANGSSLDVKAVSPDKKWWRVAYSGTPDGTAWVMAQWVTPNAAAQQLAGG